MEELLQYRAVIKDFLDVLDELIEFENKGMDEKDPKYLAALGKLMLLQAQTKKI